MNKRLTYFFSSVLLLSFSLTPVAKAKDKHSNEEKSSGSDMKPVKEEFKEIGRAFKNGGRAIGHIFKKSAKAVGRAIDEGSADDGKSRR